MNRFATIVLLFAFAAPALAQKPLYRCVGPDGKRVTGDRESIRVGEKCDEISKEERARMKAEANRPMNLNDEAAMRNKANYMDHWKLCLELGRVLRNPDTTPRGELWERVVIERLKMPPQDTGYIRERRLRIGMDECSVMASLGRPDAVNRTTTARGVSEQLIYRSKRLYVYTDNGTVRSWQD